MTSSATNDLSAYGRHAPRGWLAGLVRTARRCGTDWSGRRFAFALRAIGVRALAGRPLDVESLGTRMRLYPGNNVAEKNLLFTPQYFDPEERRFLAERLGTGFVFVDVGANVGGYALFAATLGGPKARILAVEPQADIFERLSFNIRQNSFTTVKALELRRGRPRRRGHALRRREEQGRDLDAPRRHAWAGRVREGARQGAAQPRGGGGHSGISTASSSTSRAPRT